MYIHNKIGIRERNALERAKMELAALKDKTEAQLEYIAMMTDVELPEEDGEDDVRED